MPGKWGDHLFHPQRGRIEAAPQLREREREHRDAAEMRCLRERFLLLDQLWPSLLVRVLSFHHGICSNKERSRRQELLLIWDSKQRAEF